MRVLAVGAHPDDLEFLCAGTLARYADRGDQVIMAIATNGEVGSPSLSKKEISEIRRKETEESARIIGAELIWMDFPDEFLFEDKSTRLKFIQMIRQANPDLIFVHNPNDYHSDHVYSSQIVVNARMMVTVPNIKTESPPMKKMPTIYFMDSIDGKGFNPEEHVDISNFIEEKKQMLSCHRSQVEWLKNQYGITPVEFMERRVKARGLESGFGYAEGFMKLRKWPFKGEERLFKER